MSVKLTTNLSQRLVLTPQLRQRIEMLQMTTLELSELIQQQMLENPVLEEVPSQEETHELAEKILDQLAGGDAGSSFDANPRDSLQDTNGTSAVMGGEAEGPDSTSEYAPDVTGGDTSSVEGAEEFGADEASRDSFEEIDFGREFQDYLDPGYKTQEFEYKEDAPTFEQFLTKPPSLAEHLEWQLHMSPLSEDLCDAASCVIGNLDSDGRLNATDLQQHKLPALSKQIGIPIETLLEEVALIKTLDPYPGRKYAADEPVLITPEIYIEKLDLDEDFDELGGYVIYFADDGSPRLRISQNYQQMLGQQATSKETKDFIRDKMRSAVDLLRNIEHRRQTIYKVVESIVKRQREFLDKGVEYIRPMMLKDIAEDIGMHLSTVSRVVNRKYAHTPQGVIELRRFFTEGMMNEEGEEVSTRIIKLRIKKLIEEEDSRNPITDDHVVKILVKEGIKLSRRTVAKYRDQMHIPGSRERRAVV